MPVTLTLFDHHIANEFYLHEKPNVEIILGNDSDSFAEIIAGHLKKDYDHVYIEQNLDSMISALIYFMEMKRDISFSQFGKPFDDAGIKKLAEEGKENIIVFNSLFAYRSKLDLFDKVIIINPHETGLENIPCSELILKSFICTDTFARDIAGIAIAGDYGLNEALETMISIIRSYPDVLSELNDLVDSVSLNKWNIFDSLFRELVQMFWAPIILSDKEGLSELITVILKNGPFTYKDIKDKNTSHPSVAFLLDQNGKYEEILIHEEKNFNDKVAVHKNIMIYEPEFQSGNFIREFSNKMKDKHLDNIIIMKVTRPDGKTKYSLRRGRLEINLGSILESMNAGGGNPFAAGCVVDDPDAFEREFIKSVNLMLYGE